MHLVKNTNIANIVNLHQIEKKLFGINGKRGKLPEKIASLNQHIDSLSKENETFKEKLIDIDKRKILLNGNFSDTEKKITTLNEQVYKGQSNREYEALLSEIDHLNNENNTYFKELETFENDVENINKILEDNIQELGLQKEVLLENKKKLKEANSLIGIEEKDLEKKKENLIKVLQVGESLIDVYNIKKIEYSGLAFADITRDCCSNCYSSLPPQLLIDTVEQKKLVSCPSCSIFLYFENENVVEEE